MGRDFAPAEDVAGKGNVAILGHGFWMRQFGGRAEVLHSRIDLDGEPFTVVGIMPPGFQLDSPTDLFVPAAFVGDPQMRRSVGARSLLVVGRLKSGVTVAQARQEMGLIAARLETRGRLQKGLGA